MENLFAVTLCILKENAKGRLALDTHVAVFMFPGARWRTAVIIKAPTGRGAIGRLAAAFWLWRMGLNALQRITSGRCAGRRRRFGVVVSELLCRSIFGVFMLHPLSGMAFCARTLLLIVVGGKAYCRSKKPAATTNRGKADFVGDGLTIEAGKLAITRQNHVHRQR